MGSVHDAGDHRERRRREVPGHGRGHDAHRADRRSHRHQPSASSPSSRHGPSKEDLRPRIDPARRRVGRGGALHAGAGRDALGRGRPDGSQAGEVLARVSRGRRPRPATSPAVCRAVAELFEARKPKENAIIAKVSGRVEFGKDYKAKRKIGIHARAMAARSVEYLVPKSKVDRRAGRRLRQARRQSDRRHARSARHPRGARRRGACRISRHRDPGGLSICRA